VKKSNQNKTNSKTVPIHKTFKNLFISDELLKKNSIHSEFLDHIKKKNYFFLKTGLLIRLI
jgi:hypothetical protein